MKIDHITIAGDDLKTLELEMSSMGLNTIYGGPHSNQITHMSLLGFDDGSYIELISTIEKDQTSPLWHRSIKDNAGLCAWAIEVDNVNNEAARISALGIKVQGPFYMHRQTPDGQRAEWDLAFLGDLDPGNKLPFMIKDRTARSIRVLPTPSVHNTELIGITKTVLAVNDLTDTIQLFQKIFAWPAPAIIDDANLNVRIADFNNTPLMLATPLQSSSNLDHRSWLKDRLDRFGELPCAFLIGSSDLKQTQQRFNITQIDSLFNYQIAWANIKQNIKQSIKEDLKVENGMKIGFIA